MSESNCTGGAEWIETRNRDQDRILRCILSFHSLFLDNWLSSDPIVVSNSLLSVTTNII
jgi:hypothetical protein